MSELLLQPTPNWFTSRPVDICSTSGTVACSAICSIILTRDLFDKYVCTIKDAHTKRIVALAFHKKHSNYLASCAEDLDIKVWNTLTNSLINQHSLHQVIEFSFLVLILKS
jgi:WD40 repeat protein